MDYPNLEKSENDMLTPMSFNEKVPDTVISENQEINCLKCEKIYVFPKGKDDYLAHLFLEHRLVIADVEELADLIEYLRHWRKEFKECEFEQYCTTMLLDQLPDGTPAKNEKYYLLSDILPKDYELRQRLQQQRLEKALARHQFERTDRTFNKECLYCRDIIQGLRAEYLEHLFSKHFLQLGKPENLVYVDELLAKVQSNLEQLVCLYCEKIFKDRVTLKDHMRKKGHKRINPSNHVYDMYFLINYRNEKTKPTKSINKKQDLGKATIERTQKTTKQTKHIVVRKGSTGSTSQSKQTQRKNTESSVDFDKHFAQSGDDSDSDWSDWDGEQQPPLNCLYCTHKEPEFAQLKTHMNDEHQLDFDAAVEGLNFYQKIKIVNYVRRQVCLLRCVVCNERFATAAELLAHMQTEAHCGLGCKKQWDKPEYFFPTYEDDGLLCVLDDNPNDDIDETVVRIISEDTRVAQINKDAERLSLENFNYL